MKKLLLSLIVMTASLSLVEAQIPYFGNSQGKGNTYTYFSTKIHPGENNQQMYITAQYGVSDHFDLVTDATVGTGYAYQGFGTRFNIMKSKYFTLGGQVMLDFDINDGYEFNYNSNGLYINGNIIGNLGYVANTWYTVYKDYDNVVEQWAYLAYDIGRVHPMIGINTFFTDTDLGVDLMAGAYISITNKSNVYIWGSNLTNNLGDPRIVLGFDYKF